MKDDNPKVEAWVAVMGEYALIAASVAVQYLLSAPQRIARYHHRRRYSGEHRVRGKGVGQIRMLHTRESW